MKVLIAAVAGIVLPLIMSAPTHAQAQIAEKQEPLMYVGTYSSPNSKGIYLYKFNEQTGALESLGLAAESPNASFLAFDPQQKFLYVTNEWGQFPGIKGGAVSAFGVEAATGKLTAINQRASGGGSPCFASVSPDGTSVAIANYGGSVASFSVQPDGGLSEANTIVKHEGSSLNQRRQKEPHAHSITFSPDGKFALAADLGIDKVLVYKVVEGKLVPNEPAFAILPPGSGPRHLAFHPNGRWVYVINELTCTITQFAYEAATGTLTTVETVAATPAGQAVDASWSGAEILIHPSGRFLYGSIRGLNSLAVLTIDPITGKLTSRQFAPTEGKTPRNFRLSPSGKFLVAANQDSDNLVVFSVNPESGDLAATGTQVSIGKPVCVKFLAAQ